MYLKGILDNLGFQTQIYAFPITGTRPVAKEIRIGGFGGEEDGPTGSRAYVATLPAAERAST